MCVVLCKMKKVPEVLPVQKCRKSSPKLDNCVDEVFAADAGCLSGVWRIKHKWVPLVRLCLASHTPGLLGSWAPRLSGACMHARRFSQRQLWQLRAHAIVFIPLVEVGFAHLFAPSAITNWGKSGRDGLEAFRERARDPLFSVQAILCNII